MEISSSGRQHNKSLFLIIFIIPFFFDYAAGKDVSWVINVIRYTCCYYLQCQGFDYIPNLLFGNVTWPEHSTSSYWIVHSRYKKGGYIMYSSLCIPRWKVCTMRIKMKWIEIKVIHIYMYVYIWYDVYTYILFYIEIYRNI